MCGFVLGYEPEIAEVRALLPGPKEATWSLHGEPAGSATYRRCANLDTPAGCNWLVPAEHPSELCISCQLNRTIPNHSDPDNGRYWRSIENAKRRLVAQLLSVGQPVRSKVEKDPERGVMFDFFRSPTGGSHVMTNHGNGLITLNLEEADDSAEKKASSSVPRCAATMRAAYRPTGPSDASARTRPCIRGEDWAECFAHDLHLVDSLNTAFGFDPSGDDVEAETEPFKLEDL